MSHHSSGGGGGGSGGAIVSAGYVPPKLSDFKEYLKLDINDTEKTRRKKILNFRRALMLTDEHTGLSFYHTFFFNFFFFLCFLKTVM